jgi:hypothetical protein
MTNKEAIDVLEDMKVKIAFPRSAKTQLARINEALEIAIKNLKTNGRTATNGDMIKAMFPNVVNSNLDLVTALNNAKKWWNAPYKRGE